MMTTDKSLPTKDGPMKFFPILLSAFLCFGCAAKKIAAQNADVILVSQMEKRLPLYSEQKKVLSKDVDKFLNDQKSFTQEALPLISSFELDISKVDQQYDRLNALYRQLASNFSSLMSKHMAPLDEKQQKEFITTLTEENRKLSKIGGTEQMKKVYDRFETLFGSIGDGQKKILKAQKNYIIQRGELRLKRREKLHSQIKEVYNMDLSPEGRQKYFLGAFNDYQDSYPDSPKNKEIIKEIITSLSATQKEVFKEKVGELVEILNYYLDTDY